MTNTKVSLELLNKYNVAVPRYTSYPTAPEWQDSLSQEDYISKIKTLKVQDGIALYVHIPFCEKLCWYCGCNTIIKRQKSHSAKYVQYLIKEIEQISQILGEKIKVKQLHWGGGSPNFLTDRQTVALLDKLDECFDIDYDGEIAIEIDPRTTKDEQVLLYKKIGFNRISMGIQSFDAKVQKTINRIQPYERIKELVTLCKNLNYKSINFDLIYGLPNQSMSTFITTLTKTRTLSPDRIALYSFAHLPDVINHHLLISSNDLPKTDKKFNLFLEAREFLKDNGYVDIAMDHFAKVDDELALAYKNKKLHRNFMGYTVQEPRDSIGFGLSSISYIDHTFIQNEKDLKKYYSCLDDFDYPIKTSKNLNEDDIMRQWVINKLMCTFEVDFNEFQTEFSVKFEDYFKDEIANLKIFEKEAFLEILKSKIEIKERGHLFIRNVCSTFDKYFQLKKRNYSKAI